MFAGRPAKIGQKSSATFIDVTLAKAAAL